MTWGRGIVQNLNSPPALIPSCFFLSAHFAFFHDSNSLSHFSFRYSNSFIPLLSLHSFKPGLNMHPCREQNDIKSSCNALSMSWLWYYDRYVFFKQQSEMNKLDLHRACFWSVCGFIWSDKSHLLRSLSADKSLQYFNKIIDLNKDFFKRQQTTSVLFSSMHC